MEAPRRLEVEVVKEKFPPPVESQNVRVAPERDGVAIWNDALFSRSPAGQLRQFLTRVFSLQEISVVEIDRKAGVGRLKYGLSENAPSIWRKLKEVLTQPATVHRDRDDEIRSEYQATPWA